jgi:hypothetical protein
MWSMKRIGVAIVIAFCAIAHSQTTHPPFTQKQACAQFSNAVFRIENPGGNQGGGSGFIISPDGWVATAAHVVLDIESRQDGISHVEYYKTLTIVLWDGSRKFLTPMLPITQEMLSRDFAILKIEGNAETKFPYLNLGKGTDIVLGSDLTVIGYPLSAQDRSGDIKSKFCLTGTVAAMDSQSLGGVNVDVLYFQGISIKGISGSPVIARDTGDVVGIVTLKLAGISDQLLASRNALLSGPDIGFGEVPIGRTVANVLGTLDRHLANGLGAATGIDDVGAAYKRIKRGKKNQK